MKLNANARLLLVTILAAMVFVPSAQRLKLAPRQSVNVEMQVALPLFVQVAMAAGDRFLAANIGALRALWVDNFKMQKEEFKVLAKVQERGAFVLPVKCYRRQRPTIGTEPLLDAWRAGKVDAVVVTSTEVLDNFLDMVGEAGRALLLPTPVFVPHPRIAAHAAARGLTNIVTTSATDAGLLAGLLQHFSKT